jgi:hypothetical protein
MMFLAESRKQKAKYAEYFALTGRYLFRKNNHRSRSGGEEGN